MNILLILLQILIVEVSWEPSALGDSPSIKIALTVDDLPAHGQTPLKYSRVKIAEDLLGIFQKNNFHGVHGFVVGSRVREDTQEVLPLWIKQGHLVDNHTYTHPDFNELSAEEFIREIELNESVVLKDKNKLLPKYFRFPFLHEGDSLEKRVKVRNFLRDAGYTHAPGTISYADYLFNGPVARCMIKGDQASLNEIRSIHSNYAKEVLENTLKESPNIFSKQIPHVLVIHIGISQSLWFDDVVKIYNEIGVSWTKLEEVLKDPVYRVDPGFVFERGGLLTDQVARSKGIKFEPYPNIEKLKNSLNSFCN